MVAVVSEVSQIMLNPVGMRMRMSFAAVTSGVLPSVMVNVVIAVAASLTPKVWADETRATGALALISSSSLPSCA